MRIYQMLIEPSRYLSLFLLFLYFSFVVTTGYSYANNQPNPIASNKRLEGVANNKKLHFQKKLHHHFSEAGKKVKVIVKLNDLTSLKKIEKLRSLVGRNQIRRTIEESTGSVVSRLNPSEIHLRKQFSYTKGFAAEVSVTGLEMLLNDSEVSAIYEDKMLQALTAQGLELMQAMTPRSRYDGTGVAIAVLDTGIDYNHPMLGGGGFPNDKVIGGTDVGDDDENPIDQFGHGTACAGIAAGEIPQITTGDYRGGVAPGAKLYAVKISYTDEYGTPTGYAWTSDIIDGLEWCITHQFDDPANPIKIANISFGLGEYATSCDNDSYAEVGVDTITNTLSAGIVIFAATGNNGYANALSLPACYSGVISVGAVYDDFTGISSYENCSDNTVTDMVACYSNSAPILDLLAPSHNAYTTDVVGNGGNTTSDYDPNFGGTSAASPYAAGGAAILQSISATLRESFFSPEEIRTLLVNSGDPILDPKSDLTKPRVNLQATLVSILQPGDVNGDGLIDIVDSILSLKVLASSPSDSLTVYGDINGDQRIGYEEAIYSLQYAGGKICMEGHLDACTPEEACDIIDGFWYDDSCHDTPSCDLERLEQCDSERACLFVGGYWLQDQTACIPDPTHETEPNENKITADPIIFDIPVTANLTDSSDQDWFVLDTDIDRVVTVSFATSITSTYWFISVYDASDNLLSRHDVGNNDTFDVSLPSPGSYYFVVTYDTAFSDDPYSLTVFANTGQSKPMTESEPNNQKDVADQITIEMPMSGQLMTVADQDWFVLVADHPGPCTVSFSTAVSSTYWLVSVYDNDYNLLVSHDVGNNSSFDILLPVAGNYYFVVSYDAIFSDDQYAITVSESDGL